MTDETPPHEASLDCHKAEASRPHSTKGAEGMGFEPMVGYKPTLDFESSALNQLSHPSFAPLITALPPSFRVCELW